MDRTHLYVLWTSGNPITAQKMVFMYGINSLVNGWWEKVTLIIWGAATQLASEDDRVQDMIQKAIHAGVHLTACKACADQLGVTATLEKQGIEVAYLGLKMTEILKNGEPLLTI